jgi:error-prone DNA polymerase
MSSAYVELRARSAFSFLEGAAAPEELAESAAVLGYDAIALGDRDGVYGAPRFYQAARQSGLRAMVGAELTLEDASFGDPHEIGVEPARLYVLVPDRERYQNLCRLITASKLRIIGRNADGSPKYPAKGQGRISLDDLEKFGNGMIVLAGSATSPLTRLLAQHKDPRQLCARLAKILGPDNLYIDLQRHLDPDQERLNRKLIALAETCRVPIVATNGACFTRGTGFQQINGHSVPVNQRSLLDVMTCIRLGTTLDEAGRALWINNERHLKAPAEMAELFRDYPQAIAATREIAGRCQFTLQDLGYRFPDYPLPQGETADSYLRALTMVGARERWGVPDERTRHQLEHELGIIAKLNLAGYFLIVWDIVRFCRENRIMAQGRGSAANSAVCYALGITAVDAVKMELLFERFLSEERGEWPDIDIDLPSGDQREKAIQYVYRRYGERGAAMTANVITYRVRSAVREAAKVLGFPPDQVDRLAKLNYAYEFQDQHDEFTALLRKGGVDPDAPQIRMLAEIVRRLQSLPRHLGQHSGGMVIGGGPLDEIVPLEPATMPGRVVIQWDKDDCADLGIIKIDLLGLGMLAVLEEALPLVRDHEQVALDLAHLPADDPQVYAMLQKADTVGVFQIESRAQMATLPRMKPRTFYDLVVEVAIIRPGPIVGRMVHPFLDRRSGRARICYDHPSLEPILRRTLGVPLFQEQLLRMAMAMAGFSAGEAEELRRAMGFKRSIDRMSKIEQRLRAGMAQNGIRGEVAGRIIRSITSFALYGFPESHAASFALIAYASAYLKCHHPAAFLTAMLNCFPLGFYHPATLVKDAQRHRVKVMPTDVTCSDWKCTIETGAPNSHGFSVAEIICESAAPARSAEGLIPPPDQGTLGGAQRSRADQAERSAAEQTSPRGAPLKKEFATCAYGKGRCSQPAVRLGLKYINGLREETGLRAESERRRSPFRSIADFTARVAPNKRELAAIAYSGAFAAFGLTRREALWQAAAVERDPNSLLAGSKPSLSTAALEKPPPPLFDTGEGTPGEAQRGRADQAERSAVEQTSLRGAHLKKESAERPARAYWTCAYRRGGGVGPDLAQLPAMTAIEETLADYSATSITTGPHVMAHLRQALKSRGILSAAELADAPNGSWAKAAGVVIVRQRPGTAKGLLFLTLEDETGIANAMVTPELFHANRGLLHRVQMLIVEGPLQKHEGVIHVLGRRFTELKLDSPMPKSHDFH